jgi:archaellum biogenesis ATPase FlaH
MGKTALLQEFSDQALTLGYVVACVSATDTILDDIINAIQFGIGSFIGNPEMRGISYDTQGLSFGYALSEQSDKQIRFQNKLSLLLNELERQNKGLVILVDEIQSHAVLLYLLTTTYQHFIGARKNIAIVMAGLPHVHFIILNNDVLTFFDQSKKIWIAPLSQNAISDYYAKVFYNLGKEISDFNLSLVVEMTRGYPYLLQLIGYYLLELVGDSSEITANHIELANVNAKRVVVQNLWYPRYETN